jgi:glycosyltransferase involved in cell wall biosynthesis
MTKKILYLRTDLVSQELVAGGSVTHTVGVIDGFKEQGYSVVCASSCMKTILEEMSLEQLHMLKLPSWLSVLRWKMSCLLSNAFFFFQVRPLIKQQVFSFIYQRYSVLNCVGVLLSTVEKVPLILEYNGSEVWVDKNWSQGRWLKFTWLIALIEKFNLRHAHLVVVVSQALKDDLLARGIDGAKILVNPNGVDTNLYDPAKLVNEREEIRKKLNIENKFVFGFIGTFSQWHGIEILADMIPAVCKNNQKAHFLLIGDGPLKEFLQSKLATMPPDNVTFVSTIPSREAREYLAACDAFLCPTLPNPDGSPFFGSPTKIFEYMSMGKPIIASDIGQLSELLQPAVRLTEDFVDGIGVLTVPESKRFMRAAQSLVESSDEQKLRMGSNARKKVEENYTWSHHAQNIIRGFHHDER